MAAQVLPTGNVNACRRAPVALRLLEDIVSVLRSRVAEKLTSTEVDELYQYAVMLATCGAFDSSGDISGMTDRSIRARGSALVTLASKR